MELPGEASRRSHPVPHVQCLHLEKLGHNGKHLLSGLQLELFRGELVCVVGEMGSGKTTLLRLLLGLESPDEGRVIVGGADPSKLAPREAPSFRKQVGVVFEDLKLMPARTVYENVSFPLLLAESSRALIHRKTMQSLTALGLEQKASLRCGELSRCEQQLVAVGRATAHAPLLLLGDEPSAHLDESHTLKVVEHLKSVNLKGTTIVVFTREPKVAELINAPRTLRLTGGRVLEVGPSLLRGTANKAAGMGT